MSSGSLARRRRIDDHMVLVKDEKVVGHHTYTVDQLVGSGAYAAVYRAADEMGRIVALKEYFPAVHPRDVQQLRILWEREKYVLTQVSPHPLMPTFYDAFEYNKQLYIAQEFIEGQTLQEIIYRYKKLDRDWMLKWAINLCDALTFLHERCIVHHDLKPANLKITPDGHLVVLDYGAAQYFGPQRDDVPEVFQTEGELYGTEGYLPPEVEETFVADVQTDIFALGCILYEMVMGIPPEQQRINERNLAVTSPLTQRKDVDLGYVKLVTTALSYNTEYRYGSAVVFLQELRKISPPVPMVSHKSLYFGNVDRGREGVNQHFMIYNAGPIADLQGEIVCKVPWLRVDVPKFRGKKRDVAVVMDMKRVPEFNVPLKGEVEVRTNETRSADGQVLTRADRWTINCYATVRAKPAAPGIVTGGDPATPIPVRAMKGVTGKGHMVVANQGDLPGDFTIAARDSASGLRAVPDTVHLDAGADAEVELQFSPPSNMPAGRVSTEIVVTGPAGDSVSAPVVLDLLSPLEYAKAAFGFGRRG
jgi:serine/threonine protein kinase